MASNPHYGGDSLASASLRSDWPDLSHTPLAPRVSQVDAEELDQDLVSMLGERVERALGNFKSWRWDLKPELNLLINVAIFRYAILGAVTPASPGAKLQNLKIVHGKRRHQSNRKRVLLLYLLLHPPIFPTYLLTRIRQHALSAQWADDPPGTWRRASWTAITRLETASKAWELLGWGWFLWDGQYPSLLTRILGLKLVPSSTHLARLVSYEFMNRQLVWGALTDFLSVVLPTLPPIPAYLQPATMLRPIRKLLDQPKIDYTTLDTDVGKSDGVVRRSVHTGRFPNLPPSTCPICHLRYITSPRPLDGSMLGQSLSLPTLQSADGARITDKEETELFVPAQTDCYGGCRYCYYCIAAELAKVREERAVSRPAEEKEHRGEKKTLADGIEGTVKWECLRCGGEVSTFWRVGAEISAAPGTISVGKGSEMAA